MSDTSGVNKSAEEEYNEITEVGHVITASKIDSEYGSSSSGSWYTSSSSTRSYKKKPKRPPPRSSSDSNDSVDLEVKKEIEAGKRAIDFMQYLKFKKRVKNSIKEYKKEVSDPWWMRVNTSNTSDTYDSYSDDSSTTVLEDSFLAVNYVLPVNKILSVLKSINSPDIEKDVVDVVAENMESMNLTFNDEAHDLEINEASIETHDDDTESDVSENDASEGDNQLESILSCESEEHLLDDPETAVVSDNDRSEDSITNQEASMESNEDETKSVNSHGSSCGGPLFVPFLRGEKPDKYCHPLEAITWQEKELDYSLAVVWIVGCCPNAINNDTIQECLLYIDLEVVAQYLNSPLISNCSEEVLSERMKYFFLYYRGIIKIHQYKVNKLEDDCMEAIEKSERQVIKYNNKLQRLTGGRPAYWWKRRYLWRANEETQLQALVNAPDDYDGLVLGTPLDQPILPTLPDEDPGHDSSPQLLAGRSIKKYFSGINLVKTESEGSSGL